jgi:hypothetical protein
MARASRVTLFEREIRERLSRVAVEILLGAADVLSEGGPKPADTSGGRPRYYGSTMITIDLDKHAGVVREPCDAASARLLCELLTTDAHACARIRAIAEREAGRLAGAPLARVHAELAFRWQSTRVFVDADVEGVCA